MRIEGFVDEDVLDARYLAGKTYYLLPDGVAGERPYALLERGMRDANKVALAWVVMSGREQLVMLRPLEDMLVMSVLHVHKKIKALDEFKEGLEEHELGDEELQLTQTLIGASLIEEFDFASYEDAYVERLSHGNAELAQLVRRLAHDLIAYQDEAYARSLLDEVEVVARAEANVAPASSALSETALRGLHKLMAYKDEYEVARLLLEPV